MSAPVVRGTRTTNDAATVSSAGYNALLPTGSVAGDTLVMHVNQHFNTPVLALPSGCTWLSNPAGVSGNVVRIFTKTLTSTDITNGFIALAWTGGNVMSVSIARVYQGAVTFGTPATNLNVATALSVTMTTATGELISMMSTTDATAEPATIAYATGTAVASPRTTRSGSNVRLTLNSKAAPGTGSQTAGAVTATGTAPATYQGVAYEVIGATGSNAAPTVSGDANFTVDSNLVDSFVLTATAADSDGTIASYVCEENISGTWTTVAGSGNTRTVAVTRSVAGSTRQFRWTVVDNGGASTTSSTTTVTQLPHTRWLRTSSGIAPLRRNV